MCGIAGYAAIDRGRRLDPSIVGRMLERLRHRGPDDEGTHAGPLAVLGHRRLSVVDLARGRQPIDGARPGTKLVINGEIYNHRELAALLEAAGHRLRTGSDSEVAAHAYDAWGLPFLERLDGMFALALWDGERGRLVLARDRMGEKPLYYAVRDGVLAFASELSALAAFPGVGASVDPVALSAYLTLEYVPAPRTILRGVSKLEPAQSLVLEGGRLATATYWSPPVPAAGAVPPYREAVQRCRDLLERGVRSRLGGDVPLGFFLSGGLDSGTVAALAARVGPRLRTFSVGFESPAFDETRFARAVARRIGSEHHERVFTAADLADLVPRLGAILDEPLGDASILPTAFLSAFAREHVVVTLGGDGGDELFAGYPMHQGHRVAPLFRALPPPLLSALRAAAGLLPVTHGNFTLRFRATTFLRGAGAPAPDNHVLWMSSFTPAEQRRLLAPDVLEAAGGGDAGLDAARAAWGRLGGAGPVGRASRLDAVTYLPGDILTKVDRATMAYGLEARSPFLARELAEFALALPDAYLMRGLRGKRILRDAVRDLLPPEVLARPKKGFGIPLAAWLNGPLRPLCRDLLAPATLREGGFFRPGEVARLLEEHEARRADHRKPLWTLMAFEIWRRGLRAPAP